MKKCPNCGTVNNDSAKFCVNCGTDLSKEPNQSQTEQTQFTSTIDGINNEHQSNRIDQQSESNNSKNDLHNLVSNLKNNINNSNRGKRPWFNTLDGALAAVAVLLFIIIIELGIAIANLSDIDENVGARNNDPNQSYVIHHHHQHRLPKLYMHHI